MARKPKSKVSREVTDRFLFAVDSLVTDKMMQSRRMFCLEAGYTETAYSRLVHDKEKTVSLWFLAYLCTNYPVNSDWILTGRGQWIVGDPLRRMHDLST